MIKATIQYLNQAKFYLKQISEQDYCQPIEQMSNSTIGRHTRHFLECYECLLNQHQTGKICYDLRARNIALETNPRTALQVLDNILQKIPQVEIHQTLQLKTTLPTKALIQTTLNRELLHNYEHTTHHLALIRVGITLLGIQITLPENFGIAKATILYERDGEVSD